MDVNYKLSENKELFNKIVNKSSTANDRGDLESAIAWAKIAAHFAFVRHPGIYTSPVLERLLVNIAQRIDTHSDINSALCSDKSKLFGKKRFLFVITESYGTGGHSPFIARWMKNTCDTSVHSLVTTAQNTPLPDIIDETIQDSGGWYCSLTEQSPNFVEQALFLRNISQKWADVIILLVHPYDPVPTVAFGVDGGPPILFVNHADHAFWLGTSIADFIADYHSSATTLSRRRRGRNNSKILPIPLTPINPSASSVVDKKTLGLNDEDVILLTIAREEKFYPFGDYDFLKIIAEILKKHQNAKLIAVGPQQRGTWQEASTFVDGRIHALGTIDRFDLEKYFNIADIYLESFPCGSGTSLLEAGQHKIPLLGLNTSDLPHFNGSGDDVAFRLLSIQAKSIAEYTVRLDSMISDISSFQQNANLVKENIEREHCSPGWDDYLGRILSSLPSQHNLHTPQPVIDTIDRSDIYWESLSSRMMFNELPEHTVSRLVRTYSNHLSRDNMVAAQAENLISAFTKIDSFKRSRQFFSGFKDFVNSAIH